MVAGYALLGSAWLIHKSAGNTQTFGREVSRAAALLTIAMFVIACLWTPLAVTQVALRWSRFPNYLLFLTIAIALIGASLAFWRSIWGSKGDSRPLQWAVVMTVLAFLGFAGTIWPYAIPYTMSIVEGAADPGSIKFALVGIMIVLPFVLAYQFYAYRVFWDKVHQSPMLDSASSLPFPRVGARRTSASGGTLHLS